MSEGSGLTIRGVNYDVGTEFRRDEMSRPIWNLSDVARDLDVIHRELRCSSVNLYGTDLARLIKAAEMGLDAGLHVSVQPRSVDLTPGEALTGLETAATAIEKLRGSGDLTLNVGCEISLFTRGFLPGRTFLSRRRSLTFGWPFLPIVNRRLNRHLADVASVARRSFGGPITYGAGAWESVDWEPFDLVGVNLYRDRWNASTYIADLRRLFEHGKPVVITEFGCGTFEGAERRGGGAWTIVDFDRDPPQLRSPQRRSEQTQADHIAELLDIYQSEGVTGAYVFDFVAASFPHHDDPMLDLDIASYGLVKVLPPQAGSNSMEWERKAAFEVVAQRYRA